MHIINIIYNINIWYIKYISHHKRWNHELILLNHIIGKDKYSKQPILIPRLI